VKRALARALDTRVARSALRLIERCDSRNPAILRVLTYHEVVDVPGFYQQMRHLSEHYRPVSGTDVERALDGSAALPPRAVLVTFDDGYLDFADRLWPILREHRVPAVLFVPTDFPDHPERRFWWDDLIHAIENTEVREITVGGTSLLLGTEQERRRAIKRLKLRAHTLEPDEVHPWVDELRQELGVATPKARVLGWEALGVLADDGLEIGAHTRTHPFLDRLEGDRLRLEIEGSITDLEARLGGRPTMFAYPHGRHSELVVAAVRSAGLQLAFTTEQGSNDLRHADRHRLRRINIGPRVGRGVLQARLLQSSGRL
jgi:peptidoglycan/xylan/chitin deacetylase (PgdA/CDA1 family)